MWLKMKAQLYAAGALLLGFLGLLLRNRYLSKKADRADHRADVAEAGIRRKIETEKREHETDQQFEDAKRAASEDLEHVPDHLANPPDR